MTSGRFTFVVVLGLALVMIGLSAFSVNEREVAIKLQLGRIVEANYEPGLHFKWPVIQNVRKFPKRILTISDRPERVFTAENEALQVDFFVKWRIVDAERFYTGGGGVRWRENERMADMIRDAVVAEFGKRAVSEAISAGRAARMRGMLEAASLTAEDLGVELIDVRVKKVEFMDEVQNSVYLQMAAERQRIARQRRAEGQAEAEKKRAAADREVTVILANAYRDGQILRGNGDALAAEIYAKAYTQDPEFYAFYRSMDAYRKSMGHPGDLLVLDPNNDFFRYLNQSDGIR